MLFSTELDAMKAQMTAIIVRDSEGCFDDPKESEDLKVTVRIACEFFVFLQQSTDVPEFGEADYMAGTIRSGLDWFFSMAQTGRILAGLKLQAGLARRCQALSPNRKRLTTPYSINSLNLLTAPKRLGCYCLSCR
jgi:hypothetical protein